MASSQRQTVWWGFVCERFVQEALPGFLEGTKQAQSQGYSAQVAPGAQKVAGASPGRKQAAAGGGARGQERGSEGSWVSSAGGIEEAHRLPASRWMLLPLLRWRETGGGSGMGLGTFERPAGVSLGLGWGCTPGSRLGVAGVWSCRTLQRRLVG